MHTSFEISGRRDSTNLFLAINDRLVRIIERMTERRKLNHGLEKTSSLRTARKLQRQTVKKSPSRAECRLGKDFDLDAGYFSRENLVSS
jgi:hypothetical protein